MNLLSSFNNATEKINRQDNMEGKNTDSEV